MEPTAPNKTTRDKRPHPKTGVKEKGADKLARIKVKVEKGTPLRTRKPDWIRAKAPVSKEVSRLKNILREAELHTVCEEASCPNLGECFGGGTATFMIMGDICTRRCPFCDVGSGIPNALDTNEPQHLAETIAKMGLKYVVITSVDRDDLPDKGAQHFVECIQATRKLSPNIKIEILTPDFRNRIDVAINVLNAAPPDVFNHNLETVPRLYKEARPGASYAGSLDLIKQFKAQHPNVPGKSGLMVGLGEEPEEILAVMQDLRDHNCDMLTIGQYLQPTPHHLPVQRFVHPDEFKMYETEALKMGFREAACGPMVRSSYHADQQAGGLV